MESLIAEIAAASNDQAQGIDQVNKAAIEMNKVVQRVAANAEESASASEEMTAQAEQMKDYVSGLVTLVGANGGGAEDKGSITATSKELFQQTFQRMAVKRRTPNQAASPQDMRLKPQHSAEVQPDQVIPLEDPAS